TTTAVVSAGVASFATLKFNTAGNYTLQVTDSSPALTRVSSGFTITPAAASQIVFGQPPTNGTAGVPVSPSVTALLEDQFGNAETGDNASSLSVAIASGPSGAAFAGGSTTTATVGGGVATFGNLILDTAGAYTLQAGDAALLLSSAPSASFT